MVLDFVLKCHTDQQFTLSHSFGATDPHTLMTGKYLHVMRGGFWGAFVIEN